jgi:hypothetical protein
VPHFCLGPSRQTTFDFQESLCSRLLHPEQQHDRTLPLLAAPLDDLPGRLLHGRVASHAMAALAQPSNRHVSKASYLVEV